MTVWSKLKPPAKIQYWIIMRYPDDITLRYLDVATTPNESGCVRYLSDPIDDRNQVKTALDFWAELFGVKYSGGCHR